MVAKRAITAKVTCTTKGDSDDGLYTTLAFSAHYADSKGEPINTEWSHATPHLVINMTVNAAAAEHFEQGSHYTLALIPDGSDG